MWSLAISATAHSPYLDFQRMQQNGDDASGGFSAASLLLFIFLVVWLVEKIRNGRRKQSISNPRDISTTLPDNPNNSEDAGTLTPPPKPILAFIFGLFSLVFALLSLAVLLSSLPAQKFLATAALLSISGHLWNRGKRLRRRLAKDVRKSDARAPVLFLRTFGEEEVVDFAKDTQWGLSMPNTTFQETVLDELANLGPVIGLTNPNLGDRPLDYSPDDAGIEWTDKVLAHMQEATVIVTMVGTGKALEWEISHIRDKRLLPKALFIIPPVNTDERKRRLKYVWTILKLEPRNNFEFIHLQRGDEARILMIRIVDGKYIYYAAKPDPWGYYKTVKRVIKDIKNAGQECLQPAQPIKEVN
jgi:hypothetical protein